MSHFLYSIRLHSISWVNNQKWYNSIRNQMDKEDHSLRQYSYSGISRTIYLCPVDDSQDSTTDFQPHTQGSAESQSGVKDAGWADRIGNAIDYLCRSAYVCDRAEKVRSEHCHHFRIARSFRFVHHTDLFGFFRKQPNRRGYATSLVRQKEVGSLSTPDLYKPYKCKVILNRDTVSAYP